MEPPSPTTLNGPRPLATKPEYTRRLYTSKAGLLTPSSTNSSSIPLNSSDIPDLDHFNFKRTVDESLLQPNAKRAKKIYRSILRDQYFLLDLKQLWQEKLKQLQIEHMLLSQMCNYTQDDVTDLPPLFTQPPIDLLSTAQQRNRTTRTQSQRIYHESLPVLQNVWSAPSQAESPSSSSYSAAHLADSDETELPHSPTRKRSRMQPETSSETTPTTEVQPVIEEEDQIESVTENNDADDEYLSNSEGEFEEDDDYDQLEEEDEETARKALTFMLANYGTDL